MSADSYDEAQLIERAQAGDMDAFAELVEAHQGRVYNVILRSVYDAETARDLSQEVFVQAWKAIGEFDDRAKLSTWLYRVAMNAVVSHLRYTRAQKRGGDKEAMSFDASGEHRIDPAVDHRRAGAEGARPDEAVEQSETHQEILQAISSLEDEFKQVVILRDIEGLGYEEIGEVLEINVGTVRSRLHRARERLREKLSHLMP